MALVKKLISLDAAVASELEMLSDTLKLTQKEIIERALDYYFDHTDSITAQKISDDIRAKKEQVHDAKDVFKELGLEDV